MDPFLLVLLFYVVLFVSFIVGINKFEEVTEAGEALVFIHFSFEVGGALEDVADGERVVGVVGFDDFSEAGVEFSDGVVVLSVTLLFTFKHIRPQTIPSIHILLYILLGMPLHP